MSVRSLSRGGPLARCARQWVIPMVLLLVAAGCPAAPVCEETYPLWMKLAVGLALPSLLAAGAATGFFAGVNGLLGSDGKISRLAVLCVVLSMVVPVLLEYLGTSHVDQLLSASLVFMFALALGLPRRAAWGASGWGSGLFVVLWGAVLAVVLIILGVVGWRCVDRAGQVNCRAYGEVERPVAPAGAAGTPDA